LIYAESVQEDIDVGLAAHMARFRANSPLFKDLLQDVKLRPPDILFDREAKIDLGGVTARLIYFGPGHTHGDSLIFVEEDGVLLPGDIVQMRMFPNIPSRTDASVGVGPSATGWLAMLDKVEALHARIIVPDHGQFPGDASLIGKERDYLQSLKTRVEELKKQGKSADDAGTILTPEFQAKYPDWSPASSIGPAAQRFYAELP
jgi:glyoxylase-like metal-dependent hydrolase (beta-lactamase superfamily II)